MLWLSTAMALVATIAAVASSGYSAWAFRHYQSVVSVVTKLRGERDRVAVIEREVDALRRELRKLSGRFYAAQRELVEEVADSNLQPLADPLALHPVCENYALAQTQGPRSDAAKCDCPYCHARREGKRAFRDQQVPRTVQGQADLARLNAGKP